MSAKTRYLILNYYNKKKIPKSGEGKSKSEDKKVTKSMEESEYKKRKSKSEPKPYKKRLIKDMMSTDLSQPLDMMI